jgi:hypothetical protein
VHLFYTLSTLHSVHSVLPPSSAATHVTCFVWRQFAKLATRFSFVDSLQIEVIQVNNFILNRCSGCPTVPNLSNFSNTYCGCPITRCLAKSLRHPSNFLPSLLPFSNTYCGCPIARRLANSYSTPQISYQVVTTSNFLVIQWAIRKVLLFLQGGTIYYSQLHLKTKSHAHHTVSSKVLWLPQTNM